jgi:hypothetical protein
MFNLIDPLHRTEMGVADDKLRISLLGFLELDHPGTAAANTVTAPANTVIAPANIVIAGIVTESTHPMVDATICSTSRVWSH